MTVSANDKNMMADIIALMNGDSSVNLNNTTGVRVGPDQNGVNAMKNILEAFYGVDKTDVNKTASKVTKTLVHESKRDSTLRSALITEKTEDGSRIGNFEIIKKEEGKRKFYDIIDVREDVCIAEDLTLYEAAFGIARSLSDGLPITSKVIRAILIAEADYSRAVNDAITHKHSMSKTLVESRRDILEDRFEAAKVKARIARKTIMELVKPPF